LHIVLIINSIARLEFYIALKLKLEKGMRVLDVGCGIGGPARAIARFSQSTVFTLIKHSPDIMTF